MNLLKVLSEPVHDRVDMLVRQLHVGMAGVPPSAIAIESEVPKNARCYKENEYARYAQELDVVLSWVRTQQGLEGFMLPSSDEDALRLVDVGPSIVLLHEMDRCCAILVTKLEDGGCSMKHLVLSGLSESSATAMAKQLAQSLRVSWRQCRSTFPEENSQKTSRHLVGGNRVRQQSSDSVLRHILSQLWFAIGLPIVESLNLCESPDPPRVFLYLSGFLTLLPIHAAGLHTFDKSSKYIQDYMTLYYITSLCSINHAPLPSSAPHVFAIGQSQTVERSPLPQVKAKIARIQDLVPSPDLAVLENEKADLWSVIITLNELSSSDRPLVFHLACHGKRASESVDPFSSSLYMHDKPLLMNQLMMSPILNGALVVLGACETAAMEPRSGPDKVLHIGATMQYLGFRSVIASMWAIEDADGPKVARNIHKQMFDRKESSGIRGSAKVLRTAATNLRVKGVSCMRWAAFLHIGL